MTITELRALPYEAYLQTPEWRARRHRALARAGHRCETIACRSPEHLDVHHKTYARLGCEADEDLLVLCRVCHRCVHRKPLLERDEIRFAAERYWKRHFWTLGLPADPMKDYPVLLCVVCGEETILRCHCGRVVCHQCRCWDCD